MLTSCYTSPNWHSLHISYAYHRLCPRLRPIISWLACIHSCIYNNRALYITILCCKLYRIALVTPQILVSGNRSHRSCDTSPACSAPRSRVRQHGKQLQGEPPGPEGLPSRRCGRYRRVPLPQRGRRHLRHRPSHSPQPGACDPTTVPNQVRATQPQSSTMCV